MNEDGLAALILTPTRELAVQITEVLHKVGRYHKTFSCGLVTGGVGLEAERAALGVTSIVVATPGRLRQHLDESVELRTEHLKVLVLDEADRLLDAGFRKEMEAIFEHLPQPVERTESASTEAGFDQDSHTRQTLLFSATFGLDVVIPPMLGLRSPTYLNVTHNPATRATPSRLCATFIVLPLEEKLSFIYSFLLSHPRQKVMVFASTCHQVKFLYLVLSRALKQRGVSCACLTGKMKQTQRQDVFRVFCHKPGMVLFCTDVACRGLDFPAVHWVVHLDCPDSVQTYIHRVGRTARAGHAGSSVLYLTPSETDMLYYLHEGNSKLREITVQGSRWHSVQEEVVGAVASGLKREARKAFVSYLRHLSFSENPTVLNVGAVEVGSFARSLGLHSVPRLTSLRLGVRTKKNLPWVEVNASSSRAPFLTLETDWGHENFAEKVQESGFSLTHEVNMGDQSLRDKEQAKNTQEDTEDILQPMGAVTAETIEAHRNAESRNDKPSHPTARKRPHSMQLSDLSKKAQAKFKGVDGVDVSVAQYGLGTHKTFDESD